MSKAKKTAAPKAKAEKVASATTSRTGQVGAAETKVTPVEDANARQAEADASQAVADKSAKAAAKSAPTAKEAPAREGHAVGVPRKSIEAKFGPKNPDTAETARRQAALGGI